MISCFHTQQSLYVRFTHLKIIPVVFLIPMLFTTMRANIILMYPSPMIESEKESDEVFCILVHVRPQVRVELILQFVDIIHDIRSVVRIKGRNTSQ